MSWDFFERTPKAETLQGLNTHIAQFQNCGILLPPYFHFQHFGAQTITGVYNASNTTTHLIYICAVADELWTYYSLCNDTSAYFFHTGLSKGVQTLFHSGITNAIPTAKLWSCRLKHEEYTTELHRICSIATHGENIGIPPQILQHKF